MIGVMVSLIILPNLLSLETQSLPPLITARDYVEGMWLMLQQPTPNDFVLATGEMHSVKEFTEKSFREVGMELE